VPLNPIPSRLRYTDLDVRVRDSDSVQPRKGRVGLLLRLEQARDETFTLRVHRLSSRVECSALLSPVLRPSTRSANASGNDLAPRCLASATSAPPILTGPCKSRSGACLRRGRSVSARLSESKEPSSGRTPSSRRRRSIGLASQRAGRASDRLAGTLAAGAGVPPERV